VEINFDFNSDFEHEEEGYGKKVVIDFSIKLR
jgi:hypothetical protein